MSVRHAASGLLKTPDVELFDHAAWLQFQEKYSLINQSVNNGAVEATKRTIDIPAAQTEIYYGFQITEGRRLLEYQRTIDFVGDGRFEIDLVTASGGFSGGIPAYKLKLSEAPGGVSSTVTSDILTDTTVSGDIAVVAELTTFASGATGPSAGATASSNDRVLKGIVTPGIIIRVSRIGGSGVWTSTFNGVYWEEDRP